MINGNQFLSTLWSDIEHIHAAVLAHPFITGLSDGTLPRAAFRHFITQDAHYLRDYARVLALCATKAHHDADVTMFAAHSANAVAAEQELHASLLAELGTSATAAAAEPITPTTVAYTSYLLASAYRGSYAEAVGAVLPCYWLYARVGAHLRSAGSPDPLYARWIDAYADPAFQSVTDQVLAATARLAEESSPAEHALIRKHNHTAGRHEYLFWDAAWRLEQWPV
ncbi:thiaminase II [Actinokineospora diospyrosa]|uniref:Aminopyrimidine aminohydrolase n=1 Tax=Actinokineospora diospyrosa TaxID=103728 RepID=A0ABT1I633_9PSEU|nr:thiaminase II [Actinokineospora diospyrosa]MCP2268088.1 thiaminase (transcriptional activator TenA) [Actinokineospora diospyrosa]